MYYVFIYLNITVFIGYHISFTVFSQKDTRKRTVYYLYMFIKHGMTAVFGVQYQVVPKVLLQS